MVQRGRRAVYEPEALAFEKPTPTNEDEYRRKVRMFEHCWLIVLRGRDAAPPRPDYLVEIVSHRHLRYASGLLHLVLLGTSLALVGEGLVYQAAARLRSSAARLAARAAGSGSRATTCSSPGRPSSRSWNYLRRGVPATWEAAEGTR